MNAEAWKKVEEAVAVSRNMTIKQLFEHDPDRARKYTISAAGWTLDYSKNRVDAAVMKALRGLAEASGLKDEIERMFTGEKINRTENRAVLHTALRNVDPEAKVFVDGKDVMPEVRATLSKMGDFADAVRKGVHRGFTGKRIKYVVNIGIGGSDLGPVMANIALTPFGKRSIKCFFVSNVDSTHLAETLRDAEGRAVRYDKVLVDAPCSNTGVLRRRPDARWNWSPAKLAQLTRLQAEILDRAAALVAPGGLLVYSTCSNEPEENALQAEAFLRRHSDFAAGASQESIPFETGHDGAFAASFRRW